MVVLIIFSNNVQVLIRYDVHLALRVRGTAPSVTRFPNLVMFEEGISFVEHLGLPVCQGNNGSCVQGELIKIN